jgi:cytochrome c oxidase subunit IV
MSEPKHSNAPIEKQLFSESGATVHAGMPKPESRGKPNYLLVFIALAIFTALEIATSYLPPYIKIPALIVLAVTKASLVVLYFMHLRYDNRLYALPIILGIVLAIPIILTILLGIPPGQALK